KADPSLDHVEIRIMAHDSDDARVLSRTPPAPAPSEATSGGGTAATATATAPAPAAPLDQRGTRRAPRHKIKGTVEMLVDGNTAVIIDLSTIGAQVVSP